MQNEKLILFEDKKIRRTWFNDEWWFVVIDVVKVLIDSEDPSEYVKKMRLRDESLSEGWGQIVTPLSIETPGGKQNINCASTKGIFRIIQSIPSRKAEPFKLWLAEVGYDRVQEIENPELAQDRVVKYYRLKGYSEEWIDKRLKGIAIRQELTGEWKNRGIQVAKEFAILTDEISKATFDLTTKEHKHFKGLDVKEKNQNLRDHMNGLELIFTMLGEASTTAIAKSKDVQGFNANKDAAKQGGDIAGSARKHLESKTGQKVVSDENYLVRKEKQKEVK